jgi:2-keto-3-deoxy-L-fuconate dehydrogenase
MQTAAPHVLITGGSSGIGLALARAYAAKGARLSLLARDAGKLETAKAALAGANGANNVFIRPVDVSQRLELEDAVREAEAANGPVDVLVNAAGYVHAGTVLDCTEVEWDFAFNLNVRSQFRTIQAFLPGMLAPIDGRGGHGGSIINLASVAGSLKGAPNRFVYGSTKAAVIGLTKSVAADFITRGVRCNAICPGTVESPSLRDRIAAQAAASGQTTAQVEAAFIARQPMGRLGRTTEIAALAVYLASDESAFTTGTAQVIDGGWSN